MFLRHSKALCFSQRNYDLSDKKAIKALNVYERDEYNTDKNDKKNYSFAGNGSLYSAYGSIFTGFVVCRA